MNTFPECVVDGVPNQVKMNIQKDNDSGKSFGKY